MSQMIRDVQMPRDVYLTRDVHTTRDIHMTRGIHMTLVLCSFPILKLFLLMTVASYSEDKGPF